MGDPNAGVIYIFRRTLPWIRLVSIVGFVAAVVIALFGIISWMNASERLTSFDGEALIVYAILIAGCVVPSLYLDKYARRITTFIAQGHTVQLESALEVQRGFWQFIGITLATIAGLLALFLLATIAFGVVAAV
jgi:hypothetical protein